MKKRFSDEQIISILREAEAGVTSILFGRFILPEADVSESRYRPSYALPFTVALSPVPG